MNSAKNNAIFFNHATLKKVLIYFIISIIIFYPFNPKFIVYIIFMSLLLFVLLLNYNPQKNRQFFLSAITFSILNFSSLIFTKYFVHETLNTSKVNIIISLIYLIFLIIILCLVVYEIKKLKADSSRKSEKPLFEKRKYDLERIKNYIKSVDTIGINGSWGSGKTFLISKLKKDLAYTRKYVFIDIDLLSCDLDELQTILLNEMEKVLNEHKIIPTHSMRLKEMFNTNIIYRFVHSLLMKSGSSYSESLDGFREEIKLLEKIIVIVYEDIDRISNIDTIKKIFSISEKLSGENIKVIYQYEDKNLDKLNLSRNYVEKYIPFVTNLTPIPFIELLEDVLKYSEEYIHFDSNDFSYLKSGGWAHYYFRDNLTSLTLEPIQPSNISTRRIEVFLKELDTILKGQKIYRGEQNKRVAINFFLLKIFFSDIYCQLNEKKSLLETIKFNYKNREYTILELIAIWNSYEKKGRYDILGPSDFRKMFNSNYNKEKLTLLAIFYYELETIDKEGREPLIKIDENIPKMSDDKKDRLVRNLLYNGMSEFTDYEAISNKLIEYVLSKDGFYSNQKKGYQQFSQEVFHNRFKKKDNKTILLIGVSKFITLSEALKLSGARFLDDENRVSEENWIKFINFFFNYTDKEVIDLEVIGVLEHCRLSSRNIYIYILNKFNSLKIAGNMNTEKSYRRFLKKYLKAISDLRYASTPQLWQLDMPEDVVLKVRDVEDAVRDTKSDIKNMKKRIDIPIVKKDLETILDFIVHNKEIVAHEKTIKFEKLEAYIDYKTAKSEEYVRLSKLKNTISSEEYKKKLEKSYLEEDITAYEVDELLKID